MKTPVVAAKNGINISIYVQPGASESGWSGLMGDRLKLRVAARPIEGEANKEVCHFIARFLSVGKSAVHISHGLSSRHKIVHVEGPAADLMDKLQKVIGDQDT
jgi:uncharacterized protein (TIGR00251 family)